MSSNQKIKVFGVSTNSIVDGPGIRCAVFCQGCPRSCPGCHNPESQSLAPDAGEWLSFDKILNYIESDPLVSGLTLTGGDPFAQPETALSLVQEFKKRFPDKDVWIWSGYTYEEIMKRDDLRMLAQACDVLVDGPYIESQRSMAIPWRGSTNQRIINISKSTVEQVMIIPDEQF